MISQTKKLAFRPAKLLRDNTAVLNAKSFTNINLIKKVCDEICTKFTSDRTIQEKTKEAFKNINVFEQGLLLNTEDGKKIKLFYPQSGKNDFQIDYTDGDKKLLSLAFENYKLIKKNGYEHKTYFNQKELNLDEVNKFIENIFNTVDEPLFNLRRFLLNNCSSTPCEKIIPALIAYSNIDFSKLLKYKAPDDTYKKEKINYIRSLPKKVRINRANSPIPEYAETLASRMNSIYERQNRMINQYKLPDVHGNFRYYLPKGLSHKNDYVVYHKDISESFSFSLNNDKVFGKYFNLNHYINKQVNKYYIVLDNGCMAKNGYPVKQRSITCYKLRYNPVILNNKEYSKIKKNIEYCLDSIEEEMGKYERKNNPNV